MNTDSFLQIYHAPLGTSLYYQSEGFPELDIWFLPVISPWDRPGWESCWDVVVVAVIATVGVTWYQYYQYGYFQKIRNVQKIKAYVQKIKAFVFCLHKMEYVIYTEILKNGKPPLGFCW